MMKESFVLFVMIALKDFSKKKFCKMLGKISILTVN